MGEHLGVKENVTLTGNVIRKAAALVTLLVPLGWGTVRAENILQALGRRPNTDGLHLESAGVETNNKGAIVVVNGFPGIR